MNYKNTNWFFPNGRLKNGDWNTVATVNENISWKYTGVCVAFLPGSIDISLDSDSFERIIVPLYGEGFDVAYTVNGVTEVQFLRGRKSVFHGPADVLYLPIGASAVIRGEGKLAVAEGPAVNVKPVQFIPKENIAIELRGAGQSSRQVHNFGTPANLDADRIIVCEVITPSENWSSYPPHKHDEYQEGVQSNLEEIYYFETAVARGYEDIDKTAVDPIGYMRNYGTDDKHVDTYAEVRSGDVALVPYGWHGPCVAAPGYDLYYLNVMAGPDPDRSWNIVDDPNHGWVRKSWQSRNVDSRLPYSEKD